MHACGLGCRDDRLGVGFALEARDILRHRAGQRGYEGSFIDHHLGALIYPQGLTPQAQLRIAVGLAAFNLVLYGLIAWRRLRARRMR